MKVNLGNYFIFLILSLTFGVQAECPSSLEVLGDKNVKETVGPGQKIGNVLSKDEKTPRLIDLREISWPAPGRRPPWQRNILRQMHSVFQVFKLAERDADLTPEALPVGHQDNPYSKALIPLCSGSYLGHAQAITASHCLRSKNTPVEELHIFRFYEFEVRNSHLEIKKYTDYKIASGQIERDRDLAKVILTPTPTAAVHPVRIGGRAQTPNNFVAMGFPSRFIAHPHVSLDCRMRSENCREGEVCFSSCPALGGMSGGPVVRRNYGSRGYLEQWGIVSESNDNSLQSPTIHWSN